MNTQEHLKGQLKKPAHKRPVLRQLVLDLVLDLDLDLNLVPGSESWI